MGPASEPTALNSIPIFGCCGTISGAKPASSSASVITGPIDATATLPNRWIHIDASEVAGHVLINTTDSGNGIPLAIAEKMMNPFFTTKDLGKGTGLGLSISKGIIEAHKGKIAKTESWGLRSLAYRIKKNRKAHFTLLNIDAPPAAIAEMERLMAINEDIIRTLTIKVDVLEEGPSAMLRKRDDADGERGDRGDRGDRGRSFGGRPDRGDRPDRPPRRPREEHAPVHAAPMESH